MAQTRALGEASLWRPLLHFSRAQLEGYALAEKLSWVEDESNASELYDRNFLRSQVMPLLQARWPGFQARWQQTADLCAANERMLEDLAAEDLAQAAEREERIGCSLSLSYLQDLSAPRRQNLLRYWLRRRAFTTPEQAHWQQLNTQFFSAARADASPELSIGNVSLRLFRQRLYALPQAQLAALNVAAPSAWDLSVATSFTLAAGGQLQAHWLSAAAALAHQSPLLRAECSQLDIRYRQGGERCQPAGRGHSQTLKKLLLEYAVEPWLRAHLPLVFWRGDLVAVADYWVCEGFLAPAGEAGYALRWRL
jgi:tRNA(Ile)-lysidine synthase